MSWFKDCLWAFTCGKAMLQNFSLPGRSFRRMAQKLAFLPGWHCAGQIAAFLRVFRKARAVNEWTCPAESVA